MLYEAEKGDFNLALAGDTMLTRKLDSFQGGKVFGTASDYDRLRCGLR